MSDRSSFPNVPEALQSRNPLRHLAFYGPGAIIASVTIGSGETVFASRGGAIFGYALLWCFVLGVGLKAVQVYSAMRLMTLTGHHPVDYWTRMKGPRAWFPFLMIVVSLSIVPGMYSALPKSLATFLGGPSSNLLASAILVSCALLAFRSSYRVLELSQTAVSLLFIAFIVAAFAVFRPDLGEALRGTLVPSIPDYPEWVREAYPAVAARPTWVEVMTYAGILGGNSIDYIAYLSFLRDKGWGMAGHAPAASSTLGARPPSPIPEEIWKGRQWLRAPRIDALVSFGLVALFSIVFLMLGAVILSPAHLVPAGDELLTLQARFLTELHPALYFLYVAGIVMVFLGTIYGGIELHTRALYECGRAVFRFLAETPLAVFRRFVVAYALASGLLLIWTDWDPVALLTLPALLGGLFACGLWCFSMLWADRRFVPESFRVGPGLKLALWASAILLTGFGAQAIYEYLAAVARAIP